MEAVGGEEREKARQISASSKCWTTALVATPGGIQRRDAADADADADAVTDAVALAELWCARARARRLGAALTNSGLVGAEEEQ